MRLLRNILLFSVAGVLLVGCVTAPNDRCFIFDTRYHEARRAFERTGSVSLVRQALEDAHWPECEINEAIYRIEKEFGLNDKLPSPARVRSEAELQLEQAADQKLSGNLPASIGGGASNKILGF